MQNGTPTVMVASTPMTIEQRLAEMQASVDKLPDDKKSTATSLLAKAHGALTTTKGVATQAAEADGGGDHQQVVTDEESLATIMQQLFEIFGIPHLTHELTKDFSMGGEAHTLFVRHEGAALVVEMAAARRRIFADLIAQAQAEVLRMGGSAPPGLFGQLQTLAKMVESLHQDFVIKGENKDAEAYINPFLDSIAVVLIGMGQPPSAGGYGLHSLEPLWQSAYAEGGLLKPEYQGRELRTTFYGGFNSYITDTWKPAQLVALKAQALAHGGGPDDFWCVGVPGLTAAHYAPEAIAQIDHITEVSTHWNTIGHDQNQPQRVAWNNDETNLQILCQPCNREKSGPATDPHVGPHFRGPGDP
jgi:hypothetical protein